MCLACALTVPFLTSRPFGFERKLIYRYYGTIFLFYVEKCSDYVDADVSKIYGSVSPHPVRCPVKRVKDISYNRNCNFLHPDECMQD